MNERGAFLKQAGQKVWAATEAFFFQPASPRPLAALRIGVGLILLIQALLIAPELHELYGREGLIQGALLDYLMRPLSADLPGTQWIPTFSLWGFTLDASFWLNAIFSAYVISVIFVTAGWRTRGFALVACFSHWLLLGAGFWSTYGVDRFAQIMLFYFIWFPVGDAYSLDSRARPTPTMSARARFGLRIVQLHLCLVYASTAVAKAKGNDWWDGIAVWKALLYYGQRDFPWPWMMAYPWIGKLLCYGTLFLEFAYAILIWPYRTRKPMIYAIVGLHLGIAVFLGLISFSATMIVMTVAAFGFAAKPLTSNGSQLSLGTARESAKPALKGQRVHSRL